MAPESPGTRAALTADMGYADLTKLWMYIGTLEDKLAEPEVLPHEETDLHRVFCDDHFCLEEGAVESER